MNEFTGIRDWKLQNINEGSIVKTEQGTRFLVEKNEDSQEWYLTQLNDASHPEFKGKSFSLEPYMQPNLEVVGSKYESLN